VSYVIWTRYAHPTGTVTRHVYGLYPSRAKATTERNRMLAHHADYWGADDPGQPRGARLQDPRRRVHGPDRDRMKIRQSDLGSFHRCAMQQHLYEEAEKGGQRGENLSATVLGTVVHYAVMVMEQLHHEGRDDALDIALATFRHYWHPENLPQLEPHGIDVWLPRQTYGGLRERAVRALRDYHDVLVRDDGILLGLEHTFSVPIDIDGEQHELAGTVDRLALRFYKRKPLLSVEDFKTGKRPSHLKFATQWTVYSYASTQPAFWTDFIVAQEEKFSELLDKLNARGFDLYEVPNGLPLIARRGRWLSLADGFDSHDAGWRGEHDYARLRVHLREYVKARRADVHPLTVTGHTCLYCPFARNGACGGVPIPELESGAPA
jgi:hypothetical protein